MDLGLRADVDPARRLVQNHNLGFRQQRSREHDLLLIAAAQLHDRLSVAARLNARPRHGLRGSLRFGRVADHRPPAAARQRRQRDVVPDRHQRHEAVGAPVFGHHPDAEPHGVGRAFDAHGLPADADLAPLRRRQSEKRGGHLAAACAHQPGQPQNLPAPELKGHAAVRARPRQVAGREEAFADVRRAYAHASAGELASDHQRDQPPLVQLGGGRRGHVAAVAQHGDAVGDSEDLVHLVRDVDDRGSARLKRADRREQRLRLAVRERGGRLVHDHRGCAAPDRPRDLDRLHLRHAQRAHGRVHRQRDLQQTQQAERFAPQRAAVDRAGQTPARLAAEQQVLGHGQIRHGHQLLVDHRDAVAHRLVRRAQQHPLAVHPDLARVRCVEPGQRFDERRLARAVFAHQRVHLAAAQVERNLAQRAHAAERLAHPPRLEPDLAPLSAVLQNRPPIDDERNTGIVTASEKRNQRKVRAPAPLRCGARLILLAFAQRAE